MSTEALFFNTLALEFSKEPVTFYFPDVDNKKLYLTHLSLKNFSVGIRDVFSDL